MRKSVLQKMLLTALFTALTAAGALLHIGDASLQTMFSVTAGIVLGPVWGPVSQVLYVGMGLMGVPIFVSGGGFGYVVFPTFGYLLGMILSAFVTGILTEKTEWNIWLISALGFLSVYLLGIPYCYLYFRYMNPESIAPDIMSMAVAIKMGIVYIPADFAKWFIASPLGKRLLPIVRKDLYI